MPMYNLCMAFLSAGRRRFVTAVSNLAYCNPFLAERTQWERAALGAEFVERPLLWSAKVTDPDAPSPNVERLCARLEPELEEVRARLVVAEEVGDADLAAYEESVHYF